MPKELHEITKFTAGTITVPDEKDIPEDAASYSLNIDSVTEGGKLKGVPSDLYLLNTGGLASTGGSATIDAQVMAMINRDGYRDVVYFEEDASKIRNIMDFYRTGYRSDTTFACVEGGASLDTITDSDNEFVTSGFKAGQIIHTSGFTDSDNNGAFKIDSVVAGTITITSDGDLDAESAGDAVIINTFKLNDMGAITSSEGQVTMQVHNKEVHVGAGKGSSDDPKWVGYTDHEQFGTKTVTMQMEDAELKAPGGFPQIYNAVTVGSYIYGIQDGGTRIYRFTTTAFDSASYTEFISTQGISLVAAGTDIWVYDDNAGFGTLYKIDVSEWGTDEEISQENPITGWGGVGTDLDSGYNISDIYDAGVGTVIWFSAYKAGDVAYGANWLYNSSVPSANGGVATTKRTPLFQAGIQAGEWGTSLVARLYKQCLVGTTTGVGVLFYQTVTQSLWVTRSPDTTAAFEAGLNMFNVEKDYTEKDNLDISVSGATTDCQIHEIITGGSATDYGGTSYYGGFFGDTTRLIVSKKNDTDDSEFFAFDDVPHATISAGAQSTPTARGGSDSDLGGSAPIDANGMAFAVKSDRTALYIFEQYSGGGYATLAYNDSAFSSIAYRERSDLRVTFTDAGVGTFQDDETYFWKFSFLYDGYQETPLSTTFNHAPAADKNIQLDIDLYNTSSLSKRVSHIVVYRASNTSSAGQSEPAGFFRFLKKIPIDTSFALIANGWAGSVDIRRRIFIDQLSKTGASYEARTLMPETLSTSIVNYSLSTQINSMHIVGKCYKTEIPDAMNYLFKSKVNRFDQFDWTTDFLRLPTAPTALASFNGRIYAFDENNTYRINPQGFYIEDTFEGAGCSGPGAVLVTEYGMCYCDKNNIYLHDGKSPKPIATPILTGGTFSWHFVLEPDYGHKIMFDSKRKSFLIFFKAGNGYFYAWSYNIVHNRWDLLHFHNSQAPEGVLHGKNGELFVAVSGTYLAHYLGSTSTDVDLWEWQSKYMTMGEDTSKKMFYDVKVVGDSTAPTVTYGVDGDTTPTTALSSGKVASGDKKSKSLQVKITQVAGNTHKVDSVGILYRRLPKTSGNI